MSFVSHKTKGDHAVDMVIYAVLGFFALITLFPLYYVAIVSITPYVEVMKNGGFVIWPEHMTFQAYKEIFGSPRSHKP